MLKKDMIFTAMLVVGKLRLLMIRKWVKVNERN
nr:MAG TPA: hypothetical protein [Bacteriophage sp.]